MKKKITKRRFSQLSTLLLLIMLVVVTWQCNEQVSEKRLPNSNTGTQKEDNKELDTIHYFSTTSLQRRNTIIQEKIDTGKHELYHFYNEAGLEVNMIRGDQFPVKNPVFKLNFPETTIKERLINTSFFYRQLATVTESGKMAGGVNTGIKVSELSSLKKYGLFVRQPEKATFILGNPFWEHHIITIPSCKYLVKNETASVFSENEPEAGEGKGNSLLDCSYLSVFNNSGKIIKEVMIPDKIVNISLVSDDGKFMVCTYGYAVIWDEGTNVNNEGFIIVNMETDEKIYFPVEEAKQNAYNYLFSDGYFQITLGNPNNICSRLIIDPYKRQYFLKKYDNSLQKEKKQVIYGKSLMQYSNVKDDISSFSMNRY